jgi:predicted HicB family RNase H-like nuclease
MRVTYILRKSVRQVFSMQTKLTLRVDDRLVKRAKTYAERAGKSVSEMVADYFALLGKRAQNDESALTPTVRSL